MLKNKGDKLSLYLILFLLFLFGFFVGRWCEKGEQQVEVTREVTVYVDCDQLYDAYRKGRKTNPYHISN